MPPCSQQLFLSDVSKADDDFSIFQLRRMNCTTCRHHLRRPPAGCCMLQPWIDDSGTSVGWSYEVTTCCRPHRQSPPVSTCIFLSSPYMQQPAPLQLRWTRTELVDVLTAPHAR